MRKIHHHHTTSGMDIWCPHPTFPVYNTGIEKKAPVISERSHQAIRQSHNLLRLWGSTYYYHITYLTLGVTCLCTNHHTTTSSHVLCQFLLSPPSTLYLSSGDATIVVSIVNRCTLKIPSSPTQVRGRRLKTTNNPGVIEESDAKG